MANRNFIVTMPVAEVEPCALPATVLAQSWPARPIENCTPFSADRGADVLLRNLADKLSAALGQPAMIDNKPGAIGSVAFPAAEATPAGGP